MANPIKAVKAASKFTAGKAKSVKKREVASKNAYSMQGQGGISVFKKATSNKKLGASNRAGRGFMKSKVKEMVKQEKKAGLSQDNKFFNKEIRDKGRTPFQFSGGKKRVPVKRRGK